jgi:ribosomal protein S1
VGQDVTATVLKVDHAARRISLSMRDDSLSGSQLAVGDVVDVVVNRVKQFGLLVNIKGHGRDARGMIPVEETGAGRDANLRRLFPEGSELRAMVNSIDSKANRIRLSVTAVKEQAEQQEFKKFVSSGSFESKKPQGMGTLGEALMKALKKKKE